MLAQAQIVDEAVTPYAAAADFGEVFTEEMHSLHLLSFLLTADKDKAEQCFIGALGECLEGMGAFNGMGTLVGAARDYQAGHSDDQTRPGGHGALAARPSQKDSGRLAKRQPFGRHHFTLCL
jgi:hypothetical protein